MRAAHGQVWASMLNEPIPQSKLETNLFLFSRIAISYKLCDWQYGSMHRPSVALQVAMLFGNRLNDFYVVPYAHAMNLDHARTLANAGSWGEGAYDREPAKPW